MNVLLLIAAIFLITAAYAGISAAPWLPTRKKDVERFLRFADLRPGQKMYELGCGDGRLLTAAAAAGAHAVGFEVSIPFYIISKLRCLFSKKQCRVFYRNLWNADLSDADIVYFFLMTKAYPRLKEKFIKELKKGTKVITHVWPIESWTPTYIDKCPGRSNFYVYEIE